MSSSPVGFLTYNKKYACKLLPNTLTRRWTVESRGFEGKQCLWYVKQFHSSPHPLKEHGCIQLWAVWSYVVLMWNEICTFQLLLFNLDCSVCALRVLGVASLAHQFIHTIPSLSFPSVMLESQAMGFSALYIFLLRPCIAFEYHAPFVQFCAIWLTHDKIYFIKSEIVRLLNVWQLKRKLWVSSQLTDTPLLPCSLHCKFCANIYVHACMASPLFMECCLFLFL